MALIRSFRDLIVYKKAGAEARRVFQLSKRFPMEERFALTGQIRRSSRAVNGMLAEAWGRRRYPAAFENKVSEALGEAMETQAWLDHAVACEYISRTEYREHDGVWQEICAMLTGMLDNVEAFCRASAAKRGG